MSPIERASAMGEDTGFGWAECDLPRWNVKPEGERLLVSTWLSNRTDGPALTEGDAP